MTVLKNIAHVMIVMTIGTFYGNGTTSEIIDNGHVLDPSGVVCRSASEHWLCPSVGKGDIVDLSQRQMNILTHMLGVGDHVPKKQWGYRNHYCARAGSPEESELMELVDLDLVEKGAERLMSTYFHCTELGCKAAGLSKAAILRVFGA